MSYAASVSSPGGGRARSGGREFSGHRWRPAGATPLEVAST